MKSKRDEFVKPIRIFPAKKPCLDYSSRFAQSIPMVVEKERKKTKRKNEIFMHNKNHLAVVRL
jgi:hypothetical protein